MSFDENPKEGRRQFAITVAYDGTRYGGWQVQPNAVTIQQKLQEAVGKATSEAAHVQGSGRTDSGVHAIGQVAAFYLERWRAPASRLVPALNNCLPSDIVVRNCTEVVQPFDPIRQALKKRYRYTIRNAATSSALEHRNHWWIPKSLDIDAMRLGAKHLEGTHDFKSFETLGSPRLTTTRTVYEASIQSVPSLDGLDIYFEIEADGFLYNMVRNMAGCLWAIGSGRFGPSWIPAFLEQKERDSTCHTAPPQGLCLMRVFYPEHLFLKEEPVAP
jgi:tRNA pseudouridine38-40 synthase